MKWPLFVLLVFNLVCFAMTTKGLAFKADTERPLGLKILKGAFLFCAVIQLYFVFTIHEPQLWAFLLSLLFFVSSTLLFWAARHANKAKPLTLAFHSDSPNHLNRRGPYKWIRHPFYTSYMLTYVASFIATLNPWTLGVVVLQFFVYLSAARFEEKKFSSSSLAEEYAQFKREAGMFWPHLF